MFNGYTGIFNNAIRRSLTRKMKFKVRQPRVNADGKIELADISLDDVQVDRYSILSIDGSTSNSGLAILRETDGALMYSIAATREPNTGETPVHYKVRLKRYVADMLRRNKYITQVYYEEPIIANVSAVSNLFMLRTFISEMIIENEPEFEYLKHYDVNNMRWKKLFLQPDKVPSGTENQKKAVRDRLESYMPFLKTVTQDEIDAIAMGFVACTCLKTDSDVGVEELASKKKTRPFQFETDFIGADDDDAALQELVESYSGPAKLREKSILFTELGNRENFKSKVYSKMGDDDRILFIKFSSKHHGNLIIEYKLGSLSVEYDYIYAAVWRRTRKY